MFIYSNYNYLYRMDNKNNNTKFSNYTDNKNLPYNNLFNSCVNNPKPRETIKKRKFYYLFMFSQYF